MMGFTAGLHAAEEDAAISETASVVENADCLDCHTDSTLTKTRHG
ncbi:MAG: hypothetical protein ACYDC1_20115 [Limisphaerales bacterium]